MYSFSNRSFMSPRRGLMARVALVAAVWIGGCQSPPTENRASLQATKPLPPRVAESLTAAELAAQQSGAHKGTQGPQTVGASAPPQPASALPAQSTPPVGAPRPSAPAGRTAGPVVVAASPPPAAVPSALQVPAPFVTAGPATEQAAPPPQPETPRPLRKSERHVLAFYQPSVKLYDKPYGRMIGKLGEADFPREKLAEGRTGVPVYAADNAFVELPIPGGQTAWVSIEFVRLSAVPCTIAPRTTREASGPFSAGSSKVECTKG